IGEEVAALLLKRLGGNWEDFPKHVMLRPEIKVIKANGGVPFEQGEQGLMENQADEGNTADLCSYF
ncbi:MAG: LacI family transcriptional regulator, partial [Sphaerochaeta sp.]|nr:LacI family transcriptional regulator [Sphaerochaeta sp.]